MGGAFSDFFLELGKKLVLDFVRIFSLGVLSSFSWLAVIILVCLQFCDSLNYSFGSCTASLWIFLLYLIVFPAAFAWAAFSYSRQNSIYQMILFYATNVETKAIGSFLKFIPAKMIWIPLKVSQKLGFLNSKNETDFVEKWVHYDVEKSLKIFQPSQTFFYILLGLASLPAIFICIFA